MLTNYIYTTNNRMVIPQRIEPTFSVFPIQNNTLTNSKLTVIFIPNTIGNTFDNNRILNTRTIAVTNNNNNNSINLGTQVTESNFSKTRVNMKDVGNISSINTSNNDILNISLSEANGILFNQSWNNFIKTNNTLKLYLCDKNNKNNKCYICNKTYKQRASLVTHFRVHTKVKYTECVVCNEVFSRKRHLISHERTHTGEKPFECSVCNKAFTQKHTLTLHKRIHSGEKPFHCKLCQKRFRVKHNLKKHEMTHSTS